MRCGSTTSNYERDAAAASIMKYHYVWLMWSSAYPAAQGANVVGEGFHGAILVEQCLSAPLISGEFVEHRRTIHCVENSSLFESPRLKDIRVHSLATLFRLLRLPSARMGFESF